MDIQLYDQCGSVAKQILDVLASQVKIKGFTPSVKRVCEKELFEIFSQELADDPDGTPACRINFSLRKGGGYLETPLHTERIELTISKSYSIDSQGKSHPTLDIKARSLLITNHNFLFPFLPLL
jgi:hypothetical protein